MKIVFVARQGPEAEYIATELLKAKLIDRVVFETGRLARQRKLKRMLKNTPIWLWWRLPLDLLALKWLNAPSAKAIESLAITKGIPHETIDDINEEKFVSEMKSFAPDLIVIYGTAIAQKPIREVAKKGMINFHGAMVPFFRNVYGDFWALALGQYSRIGTSILWVDGGVDTGDIVTQRAFGLSKPITLSELRKRVLVEGTNDLVHALQDFRTRGELPHVKVIQMQEVFHCVTPTVFDVLKSKVLR